ncbi:MAG: outer membrane protein heavy metal efflux system [Chthoniobacter sp.]|jgi:outer membrane protein TolC|nr:outer membrane protein heavy metal efflux system [Chthoniobacter sp.]
MTGRLFLPTALALAGCVQFAARPLDPAANAARLSDARLADKTWTLQELADEAAKNQPEVAVARAQYETAQAAIGTAGERPNPTIALSPQIVTPYTALIAGTYGVDFDWTFETAGKRSRRREAAHHAVRAAAARVVDASWKARVAVRKAMLEIYAGEERVKLLGDAITQQEALLKVLGERIQAGAESRSITAQPRLMQAQLRLQVSDAAKGAALGRAALAEALGMSTSGLLGVKFSFAPFEGVPLRRVAHRREALTHRADVLAALADYAVAESTLRLEIAKQYPDLHLNPGYQLDAGENKWTLGVGITLPILNQNRGPIAEADAKREEAAAKFNAVQAKVLADCDRAAAAVHAARAKLAVTDELLAEQARQLGSEARLVEAGEGDKLALLSARVERATTLTSRLDALVELQAALGALEEATQSPLVK